MLSDFATTFCSSNFLEFIVYLGNKIAPKHLFLFMKVSNVKPWQQISKQKQRNPLKETCSKLKFEPMKHTPTNRATGVVNIFTMSA